MDAILLEQACRLYHTSPKRLSQLTGGHSNAVYRYPLHKGPGENAPGKARKCGVLRLGVEDCPADQTREMLEWVDYLNANGAPVSAPITSSNGRLVERIEYEGTAYTVTAFEEARGTLAERIPPSEWTDELFRSIGRAVGKMHAVSKGYQPAAHANQRPAWYESYEIREAMAYFAKTADPARDKLGALVNELRQLPALPEDYGLIHDDLHFANFLVLPEGGIKIIDFDDCGYGWFVTDIAMALFDVLVLYNASGEEERQAFARRFLGCYLEGYRGENYLNPSIQSQIPRFLKLKEICVYAPLVGHADIQVPDSWVGRFMKGRAARIADDVPYVDIDFTNL
jgi:Ser/Thr protein kinase RdoA (MazF antagonist)